MCACSGINGKYTWKIAKQDTEKVSRNQIKGGFEHTFKSLKFKLREPFRNSIRKVIL